MNDEIRTWLHYAEENLKVSGMCLKSGLLNPCLQNAQQAVEKTLKALCVAHGVPLKRTHSISELRGDLLNKGVNTELSDEECELLDSIYLPSKYPLGSALPDFEPTPDVATHCLSLAERVFAEARGKIILVK
ncbi:MAG: HEPN domain-containing protein [bacterium]